MGNSFSSGSAVPQNWKQVTPHLYENTESGELIEVSSALLPKGVALENYSEWYEVRLDPSTKYVRVIDYKLKGSICCNSKKEVMVFSERIYTLDQLELSAEEANYVFSESLLAFKQLFEEFGLFPITKRMVGINDKGVPKVWISQNYAQNHLDEEDNDWLDEERVVDSLIQAIDQSIKCKRLEAAFRSHTAKKTLESALIFIQRLQKQQQFPVHEVFLNRADFEAYRARSTVASKQTMDFSFAAKHQKLELSSHSKMEQSKPLASITSSLHSCGKQSIKIINVQIPSVRQSVQIASSSHSSHAQHLPALPPHQPLPLTNLPHMHNSASTIQPNFHKAIRTSAEEGQAQRYSAGTPAQRFSEPQMPVPQVRMSAELKADPKRQPPKINIISPAPMPKPKAAPKKAAKAETIPPAPLLSTSKDVYKNANTVTTINTINTLNPRSSRENSGLLQHQLSRVGQSSAMDFTLNRVSTPLMPDSTTDLDRGSSFLKKSDSERLLEYRQAEMYKSIPKVDSVVLISHSDNNHEVIDIANPPENYRISLIESTIERGLEPQK